MHHGSRLSVLLIFAAARCTSETSAIPPAEIPGDPSCSARACGEGCLRCEDPAAPCAIGAELAFCGASGECAAEAPVTCPIVQSGRDREPGSGEVFVIDSLVVAGPERAFDLDGRCRAGECGDHGGAMLPGYDLLVQYLLGGDPRVLLELARDGKESSGTIKLYTGRDADDPFFPANDFRVPPGHSTCCEFLIRSESLRGSPPQAIIRLPVIVDGLNFRSAAVGNVSLPLFQVPGLVGIAPLERALIAGRLDENGTSEVILGGASVIFDLARLSLGAAVSDPPVPVTSDTALDTYLAAGMVPSLDLDGDGLEQLVDDDGDGKFDRCLDGCAGACESPDEVAPLDPQKPRSCAESPRMADGFAITYAMTAVPATILGIARF